MLLNKIKERLIALENALKNFKEETRKDIENNNLEITKLKYRDIPRLEKLINESKAPDSNTVDFGANVIEEALIYLKNCEEQKILHASISVDKESNATELEQINKSNYMIDVIDQILVDYDCDFWEEYYDKYENDI